MKKATNRISDGSPNMDGAKMYLTGLKTEIINNPKLAERILRTYSTNIMEIKDGVLRIDNTFAKQTNLKKIKQWKTDPKTGKITVYGI